MRVFDSHRSQIFPNAADVARSASRTRTSQTRQRVGDSALLPATAIGQAAWQSSIRDEWKLFQSAYLFDVRELTDSRPYFSAYVKPSDLGEPWTGWSCSKTNGAISPSG